MFRDVPECSGMFRHVPECSMFRVLSTAGTLLYRALIESNFAYGCPVPCNASIMHTSF